MTDEEIDQARALLKLTPVTSWHWEHDISSGHTRWHITMPNDPNRFYNVMCWDFESFQYVLATIVASNT